MILFARMTEGLIVGIAYELRQYIECGQPWHGNRRQIAPKTFQRGTADTFMSHLVNALRQGVEILWSTHLSIYRLFNTLAQLLQYLFVVHDGGLFQTSANQS